MKSSRSKAVPLRASGHSWSALAGACAALLTLRCAAADPEQPAPDGTGTSTTGGGDGSSNAAGGSLSASSAGNANPNSVSSAGATSIGLGGSSSGGASSGGSSTSGGSLGFGGSAGTTNTGAATFAAVSSLLAANCAGAKCHGGTAEVNFTSTSGLYSRLMTPVASTIPHCAGTQLIAPGNTAGSFLLSVVQGKSTCKKGTGTESINRMPDECSTTSSSPRACLTAAQIQTISAWISAGAPQ